MLCKFQCQTRHGYFEPCEQPVTGHADRSKPSERIDHKGGGYTFLHPNQPSEYCYYHEKVVQGLIKSDWAGRAYNPAEPKGFTETTTPSKREQRYVAM